MAVVCLCEAEDQLSLAKHAQDVQEALSTKHITILIPTIHSKLDPKFVIFASAPAVSARAATVTSCVAPPSTPTPSVVKAVEDGTLLDYVEWHQRVQ